MILRGRSIAGVRTRRNSPVRFVDASGVKLRAGDRVEVELGGDGSIVEAEVAIAPGQLLAGSAVSPAGRVVRLLSGGDCGGL